MQPWELLVLVAIILVVRITLTIPPVRAKSGGRTLLFAHEYLDPFIVAGLAAFLLITFVARTYYIPSGSMIPTLQIHDVLLVNKIEYRLHPPHHQDIAVFPPPAADGGDDDFIKRVIGVPGDTLRIQNGIVYRNGVALQEPYENAKPNYNLIIKDYGIYVDSDQSGDYQPLDTAVANIPPRSQWTSPDTIPPHCYFMMGDNRNDSEDSHYWGFAQDTGTFVSGPRAGQPAGFTGHAMLIFWPLNRLHIL